MSYRGNLFDYQRTSFWTELPGIGKMIEYVRNAGNTPNIRMLLLPRVPTRIAENP
jgi:hypothetical protein